MNKKIVVLISAFLVFGVITLYDFYLAHFNKYIHSDWSNVQKLVTTDCKNFSPDFIQEKGGQIYTMELLKELKMKRLSQNFTDKLNAFREIPFNESYCWVVWVGDINGNGQILYETVEEGKKILDVTGFPYGSPALR